jgi:hypothetical protein
MTQRRASKGQSKESTPFWSRFGINLSPKAQREILGIVFFLVSGLTLLTLLRMTHSTIGDALANLLQAGLGWGAFALPLDGFGCRRVLARHQGQAEIAIDTGTILLLIFSLSSFHARCALAWAGMDSPNAYANKQTIMTGNNIQAKLLLYRDYLVPISDIQAGEWIRLVGNNKAKIYCDDTGNAANFSAKGVLDVSGRKYTSSYVKWNITLPYDVWIKTPSLVEPIQEVINRGAWKSGNSNNPEGMPSNNTSIFY